MGVLLFLFQPFLLIYSFVQCKSVPNMRSYCESKHEYTNTIYNPDPMFSIH